MWWWVLACVLACWLVGEKGVVGVMQDTSNFIVAEDKIQREAEGYVGSRPRWAQIQTPQCAIRRA